MIIREAHIRTVLSSLANPYTIAYESISAATNHFLTLVCDSGETGVGCSAPAPEVTGESSDDALAALTAMATRLQGLEVHDLRTFMAGFRADFQAAPSACAALDMALFDAWGRAVGAPVRDLLLGQTSPENAFLTSVTIGICSVEESLIQAARHLRAGFRFLKVKGGHDVKRDIDRLKELRGAFGNDVLLSLDANQGYSPEDVALLDRSAGFTALQYIEQPVAAGRRDLLADARRRTDIPVIADEAVCSMGDLREIIRLEAADLINIKLQKVGGLCVAEDMDRMAADAGLATMLGSMDESALSISAALAFASVRPNVRFVDLDGHLDLDDDPFSGLVRLKDGFLTAKDGPGLGRPL